MSRVTRREESLYEAKGLGLTILRLSPRLRSGQARRGDKHERSRGGRLGRSVLHYICDAMQSLPKITASLLFLCTALSCFAQDDLVEEILQLTPEEVEAKKIKSCTSVIYCTTEDDSSCAYGDYFVFDTAGRILGEHICSRKLLPEINTYTYDPSTNKLAESWQYTGYTTGAMYMEAADEIKNTDRDSMLHEGILSRSTVWRNGKQIHTTSYDHDGGVEWDVFPVFDENDSIVQVRRVELGRLREVRVYSPDGKLLVDSSFDGFGVRVENYNEHGDPFLMTSFNEDGAIIYQLTSTYVYDTAGRYVEMVQKNGDLVVRTAVRGYDAEGNLAFYETRDAHGRILVKGSQTITIHKTDTIIYTRYADLQHPEERFMVTERVERIFPKRNTREIVIKQYFTNEANSIIGDTITTSRVFRFNDSGDILSSISNVNGKEEARYTASYDRQGRPVEYIRTDVNGTETETFTYYSDGTMKTHTKKSGNDTWTVTYNPQGKVVKNSNGVLNNPERQVTRYTFNEQGLMIRQEKFEDGKRLVLTEFTYTFYAVK